VARLVAARETNKNFVIYGSGEVVQGFAEGIGNPNATAMQALQNIRRRNDFLGTYPLLRAADGSNESVFLDERVLEVLNGPGEQLFTPEPQGNALVEAGTDPSLYNASIPIIQAEWNEAIDAIIFNASSKLDEKKLRMVLESTPMYIGPDAITQNDPIVRAVANASDIPNLQNILLENTRNTSSIAYAIHIAQRYDRELDFDRVLNDITDLYNEKHSTELTPNQIASKQYEAGITAQEFYGVINKHSKNLEALGILNAQGGLRLFSYDKITIDEAINAAQLLGKEDIFIKVLEEYNAGVDSHNESIRVNPDDENIVRQAIRQVLHHDHNITEGRLYKFAGSVTSIDGIDRFQKFLSPHGLELDEFKDQVRQARDAIVINEEQAQRQEYASEYDQIQFEFLSRADLVRFNHCTVSFDHASPKEDRRWLDAGELIENIRRYTNSEVTNDVANEAGLIQRLQEVNAMLEADDGNHTYVIPINQNALYGTIEHGDGAPRQANHWTAIRVHRQDGGITAEFIDPMGRPASTQVEAIVGDTLKIAVGQPLRDRGIQYVKQISGIELRGNDYDCGPLLVYALSESHGKLASERALTERESIDFGQRLRQAFKRDGADLPAPVYYERGHGDRPSKDQHLKRSGQLILSVDSGQSYNMKESIAAINKENQALLDKLGRKAVITADIDLKSVDIMPKVDESGIGKVEFLGEQSHQRDHASNIKNLIEGIKSGEIGKNTVIGIERKSYGNNLGIPDMLMLANILEHNEKYPTKKLNIPKRVSEKLLSRL